MNILIRSAIAAVSFACVLALSANATPTGGPITGSITFTGGVTLDNNADAGSSTKVLTWTGASGLGSPVVLNDSGSFASFVSAGATVSFMQPWKYNSGAINNFWSVGGFVFNMISSQVTSETAGKGVLVSGTGMITGPAGSGLTSTAGTWTFSASDPTAGVDGNGTPIFSFQGNTTVPDGGMTLMLLSAALLGLGTVKRTLKA
jgi:hypothetical protein